MDGVDIPLQPSVPGTYGIIDPISVARNDLENAIESLQKQMAEQRNATTNIIDKRFTTIEDIVIDLSKRVDALNVEVAKQRILERYTNIILGIVSGSGILLGVISLFC